MNIFDLLTTVDPQKINLDEQMASGRRAMFRQLGDWGKKMALGAIPFGAATLSSKNAMAAHEDNVDVLNFALLLEYLESEFYIMGLDTIVPKGTDDEKVFMQISKHEKQHVEFLQKTIKSLGGMPIDKPAFDFTAGGAFMPFSDYDQFKVLSQAFEDTGVRAYKGQAANLMDNDTLLTAALQIHSVEARHAAKIRMMRDEFGWIYFNHRGRGMPYATQPVYKGENMSKQAGIELKTITTVEEGGFTAAFDEPLTKEEVTAIASLFLKK
ncbi:ferritin-like domain-containing protein [Rhodocytophaga aerolata]|uniref:Ferritin-like domain-containing protein n=1 Tax=Rhodocytophaga aerolata TaxID=455078 RepID=A0ABT8RJL0_9BACT|nr:ferritin-like domain-containing protein [Rhodocytophaga aerolata]MDO1451120.1 ferritin-like domain-containing protein [Rhodocytophaga aerolata]